MDHRWGRRVRVDYPVRVAAHRFVVRDGRLIDLSVSGALIEADVDARILSRVQIVLLLPSWPRHEAPTLEAYVARKHRQGIGVEWCEFAPRAIRDLLRESFNGSHGPCARTRWTEIEVRSRPDA
jgi:hypothetical protein